MDDPRATARSATAPAGRAIARAATTAAARSSTPWIVGAVLAGGSLLATVALLLMVLFAPTAEDCADGSTVGPPGEAIVHDAQIAGEILRVGVELGASERTLLSAFEAAIVESRVRNLPCEHPGDCDADSVGVFQQRPSMGWGTPAQLRDVTYATTAYYLGAGGNRGAIFYDTGGRGPGAKASGPDRSAGHLAQTVQGSAHPERYDAREADARALLAQTRAAASALTATDGWADTAAASTATDAWANTAAAPSAVLPGSVQIAQPVTIAGAEALIAWGFDGELGGVAPRPDNPDSDHPAGYALDATIGELGRMPAASEKAYGDQVAAFLLANQDALNVRYVIWYKQISHGTGWEPYSHRAGSSVTLDHYDHVHVSFHRGGLGSGEIVPVGDGTAADPCAATGGPLTVGGAYVVPIDPAVVDPARLTATHHTYPAWDLPAPEGTTVLAAHAGTVVGVTGDGDCGNGVIVAGADGFEYTYCHAVHGSVAAAVGDQLVAGDRLMGVGTTGSSSGNHLHFQLRAPAGHLVCPQDVLPDWHAGTTTSPAAAASSGCTHVRGSR